MATTRLISLLLISVLLSACEDPQPTEQASETVRPVKLFTVGESEDNWVREFPGEVVAHQGSYLGFRVSGELVEFPVRAGQQVEKGQLIAKLDPEDYQLQYNQRKAQYDLTATQLKRVKALYDKNIVSQSEYDQAVANEQVAKSAYNIAKTNLNYTELRAPFTGVVAKVFVKNFESIQAKQNIVRLETRDMMDVEIQIPEKLVARVNKSDSEITDYHPTVIFDAYPDKAYSLTIKEYDTQADPATLTYRVVFQLPVPKDFNLLAGMTAQVYIDFSKISNSASETHKVPVEAVFSDPHASDTKRSFVWIYNPESQVVTKREVQVGELHRDGIDILEGLTRDDQIVAAGVHYLESDMKVRPWTKERGL